MASIQEKKNQFINRAKQKVAEIGHSMVDQRETGLLVFNDAYYIDELLSGIEIIQSTYCGLLDDDAQAIIDYLDYKYSLTELPVNVEIASLNGGTIVKDGQSIQGPQGEKGDTGADGYTPVKNVDYFDGADGADGSNGADGYTPVKNVDYFDGADGADGSDGIAGEGLDGWTPVLAVVANGDERVHQIANWISTGTPTLPQPSTIGWYIGAVGYVEDINDAVDIRGSIGDKGDVGQQGIKGESGYGIIDPVQAATTVELDASYLALVLTANINGAISAQDGYTLAVGERLLVKDQTTLAQNGIYEVTDLGDGATPYILTRASDFNTTQLLRRFPQCFVEGGATQGNTNWTLFEDRTTLTLDTSDISFAEQQHPLQANNVPVPGNVTSTGPVVDEAIAVYDETTGQLIKQSETVINSVSKKLHTPTALVSKDSPTTEIGFSTAKAIKLIADSIELLRIENDSSVGSTFNYAKAIANFIVRTPNSDFAINLNATNESLGVFQSAPNSSAALDIGGGKSLLLPRMSTGQRDTLTPANGMCIYNTTTTSFQFYQNGAWVNFVNTTNFIEWSGTVSTVGPDQAEVGIGYTVESGVASTLLLPDNASSTPPENGQLIGVTVDDSSSVMIDLENGGAVTVLNSRQSAILRYDLSLDQWVIQSSHLPLSSSSTTTLYVDGNASSGGDGSLAFPYNNLEDARDVLIGAGSNVSPDIVNGSVLAIAGAFSCTGNYWVEGATFDFSPGTTVSYTGAGYMFDNSPKTTTSNFIISGDLEWSSSSASSGFIYLEPVNAVSKSITATFESAINSAANAVPVVVNKNDSLTDTGIGGFGLTVTANYIRSLSSTSDGIVYLGKGSRSIINNANISVTSFSPHDAADRQVKAQDAFTSEFNNCTIGGGSVNSIIGIGGKTSRVEFNDSTVNGLGGNLTNAIKIESDYVASARGYSFSLTYGIILNRCNTANVSGSSKFITNSTVGTVYVDLNNCVIDMPLNYTLLDFGFYTVSGGLNSSTSRYNVLEELITYINLPTSAPSLSGAIWSNAGVLTIV